METVSDRIVGPEEEFVSETELRIIYLNAARMPSRDANSVQIAKMCAAFGQEGNEVTLLARQGDAPAATIFDRYGVVPDFGIDVFPASGPRGFRTLGFLLRVLRRARASPLPDLFYAREPLMLALVASLGRPMIYEAHYLPPRNSIRFKILPWLFRRSNFALLVCTTDVTRSDFRKLFPDLPVDKIVTEPVAAAEFTEPPCPLSCWPGRAASLQAGFVGRPFKGKGIETIVAAALRLPGVDFHVIGADRADLDWIEQRLPSNLYLHGYKKHGELGGYYRKFDIAVAPYGSSVHNASGLEMAAATSPLKVLEYLAAGLPVITSDLPGICEVVESGVTCLMIPPGDEDAFVEAVARLRDDKGLRDRLAAAGHRRFRMDQTVRARARRILSSL